ncbi:hypothetical protein GMORB2_7142 [Geosmithia morbida]|uniref:F-box domain-containing protein n=1 Tax=Geosmithia morbida TaxID=1094350 RepID=A0A9P4YU35_9HYPO|nr:uncharacterized protein GMORB2_7142 [Geosmithia morbida]KAF4122835.1 hypothetical protein GMORB2_7142 [Geosmithia morbida]
MATISDLPCEVIAAILSRLGTFKDLINAICVSRQFLDAFVENRSIAGSIVVSFFEPERLALAVATEQLNRVLPAPRTAQAVGDFVDGLVNDGRLLHRQLRSMSLQSVYSMMRTEDSITDLAFDFADRAWEQFYFDHTRSYYDPSRSVGLSPTEAFRFFRAFYRTEIFLRAFRTSSDSPDPDVLHQGRLWLLRNFAQFEIEQIACVHDYLEKRFMIACLRTFFEDVELGAMGIDFLTPGANPKKQHWISQGATFITKLAKASTEYKGILLKTSLIENDSAAPFVTLQGVQDVYLKNKRLAAKKPRDTLDSDSGPPSAFDYAFADLLEAGSQGSQAAGDLSNDSMVAAAAVLATTTSLRQYQPTPREEETAIPIVVTMMAEDSGLRERAYVFWDMARIKDWNLWEQIEISPREATTTPTRLQYAAMRQLWRTRKGNWAENHVAPWYVTLTTAETGRLMGIFKLWGEEALAMEPWDDESEDEWVDE